MQASIFLLSYGKFSRLSGPLHNGGELVARRPNYGFEKKQREIRKQKKKQEKAEKKRLKKEALEEEGTAEAPAEAEEEQE